MIVYGDPSYRSSVRSLSQQVQVAVAQGNADGLRTALALAGQLEQGLFDDDAAGPGAREGAVALTDSVADGFLLAVAAVVSRAAVDEVALPEPPAPYWKARVDSALLELAEEGDLPLHIKVPEGYAFYALYPEQYLLAVENWIEQTGAGRGDQVLVVGLRSIGTSLSAMVRVALRWAGIPATRLTVRPSGHPFERLANLDPARLAGLDHLLVVDEGPGVSGSSMAAIATAALAGGLRVDQLAFLPAHSAPPGREASPAIRRIWSEVRRNVVPLDEVRWGDLTLPGVFGSLAATKFGCSPRDVRVSDIGRGGWRALSYPDMTEWPAVASLFERAKFHCQAPDGSALVWKFVGFDRPSETTSPLGFSAQPWLRGRRLTAADASRPEVQSALVKGLRQRRVPTPADYGAEEALQRLQHLLYRNILEELGEGMAEPLREWAESSRAYQSGFSYVDGRFAPHEWVETEAGEFHKTDQESHALDHTAVGPQDWYWDIAGVAVEWRLEPTVIERFAEQLGVDVAGVMAYRLPYAAFRLGLMRFCQAAEPPGSAEIDRLKRAGDSYRRQLVEWLQSQPPRTSARAAGALKVDAV